MNLLNKFRSILIETLSRQKNQGLLKANELIRHQVLSDFINNIYSAENLPLDIVKQNLESSVLEIIYSNGQHSSCGVLITTDGYFLTCYHCVNKDLDDLSIVLHDSSVYSDLKLCAYSKAYDIALVKAPIPVPAQAIKYPFYVHKKLNQAVKTESTLALTMTRRDGKLVIFGGLSEGNVSDSLKLHKGGLYQKQIRYESASQPGDSGGIIVRLADLKVCGLNSLKDIDGSAGFYAQWHNAIELISRYKANSKTDQR